jgi:hypothetical protein
MSRTLPSLVVFCLVVAITSCSTMADLNSDSEVWKIHLLTDRGQRMGMIRIQLSDGSPEFSCVETPRSKTRLGTIIETKGIDPGEPIGDHAAVYIDGNDFSIDLNLGWCDGNGVLFGHTDGRKAAGEYLHQTEVGYLKLGDFYGYRE